ncbi:hypothetical protein AAVH_10832 [Aphelenchoides avenae]|nr:hypothetical protein AAVH_10832 [Aphelenchus avenae]
MPDLIRMLTSTELMSGVRNVLVVVGGDAMLADEKVETFQGQCQKLLGYLKGFPNVKVTWLVPPFVEDKKGFYEEWLESIATVLNRSDIDLVWSTRYRSVLEITRYGNRGDGLAVDSTGALTNMGRRRTLELSHHGPQLPRQRNVQGKKEQDIRKRDSAPGDRFNGHGGQSYYGKTVASSELDSHHFDCFC